MLQPEVEGQLTGSPECFTEVDVVAVDKDERRTTLDGPERSTECFEEPGLSAIADILNEDVAPRILSKLEAPD